MFKKAITATCEICNREITVYARDKIEANRRIAEADWKVYFPTMQNGNAATHFCPDCKKEA